ncbi:hypothetical protein LTR37_000288 [Vermiconidia calcicola]|uniref:Uncharacterized protein n=1 Tax=Vermiconidia calcicola TaxID=1690605 RepID=A0ACC3P1F3_9PEZI|nr:hypothetical protein LTR37_000288 [Vermiconidia calcicola]
MGADVYIATDEDEAWPKQHARSLDLIVCTVNSHKMPLTEYLGLLRVYGTFIQVGAPEDVLPELDAGALIGKGIKIGGSMIGSPTQIEDMLQLAAGKKIKAWIQTVAMRDANRAIVDQDAGKARYRYTLVNESNL